MSIIANGSAPARPVPKSSRPTGRISAIRLQLIAAVTRVLPDDTYLTDLTLRDGTLTLTGQSPGAVKLIPALSADPAFVAPAFSAPVTRIESNNADLFSIRTGVASPDPTSSAGASR